MTYTPPPPLGDLTQDGAFLDDLKRGVHLIGFVLRAARRHIKLAALVFLSTLALVAAAVTVMPKLYRVETRVLTHRNYIIPALVSPRRAVPFAADAPTRGAVELMLSRDSLQTIAHDARLVQTWAETRHPMGRFLDAIRSTLLGPMTEEGFREAILEVLGSRLSVFVDGDVVVMEVEWHDPQVALAISKAANQRFIDMKRSAELSEVRETLGILEANIAKARDSVQQAGRDVEAAVQRAGGGKVSLPMRTVQVRRPAPALSPEESAEKDRLEREVDEVRRQIAGQEGVYQRRLDEARATLNRLRQSLGPDHPDMQQAVRAVEERSRPPQELERLRTEEAEILARLAPYEESRQPQSLETIQVPDKNALMASTRVAQLEPEVETTVNVLQDRIRRHNELLGRLDEAKTELATSEAAFNYRYVQTLPPILPKRHIKPKVPVLLAGGALAGLVLGFLFAALADLLSRRVVEPWQVRAATDVPMLGIIVVDTSASGMERGR